MTLDESARRFVDHPSTGVAVVRLVRALVSEGWNSPQIAMLCAAAAGLCATAVGTGARDEWVETLQAVIDRAEGQGQAGLDEAAGLDETEPTPRATAETESEIARIAPGRTNEEDDRWG